MSLEQGLAQRLRRYQQWQSQLNSKSILATQKSPTQGQRLAGAADQVSQEARAAICAAPLNCTQLPATSNLRDGTEMVNSRGTYWHLARRMTDVWPGSDAFLKMALKDVKPTGAEVPQTSSRPVPPDGTNSKRLKQLTWRSFLRYVPRQMLLLDLETCGLAGSQIFLAGIVCWSRGELHLEQLWARSPAEEAALLTALAKRITDCELLVSFNGKSFDWPQVRDRLTWHTGMVDGGLPTPLHWDLLHAARQVFRGRFADYRLQTLERHLCGRYRVGDIPGSAIPSVYAAYVRTGDEDLVQPILHHNALDLVTLLDLVLRIGSEL